MTAPSPRPAAPSELPPVARFKAALDRLWLEDGKLGLAVSGGADSLALMLLADAAIPGRFEVATVDHRLRAEAAEECALVARVCAERNIACDILRVSVGGGNLQAGARQARYAALLGWALRRDLPAIATAHHADDQAETLLMRLNRGSGVAGLAGVRERAALDSSASAAAIIRPLLLFRRVELDQVVAAAGVTPTRDPSNGDTRFERVRIRQALAGADWLDPIAIARSASHLAEADAALAHYAALVWAQQVRREGEGVRFRPSAPQAVRLRVVARILGDIGGEPHGGAVATMLERLASGQSANLAGVLATVEGDEWVFRPEPPRRGS